MAAEGTHGSGEYVPPIVDLAAGTVLVGGAGADHKRPEHMLLRLANRHGLIAGATGTGKTVTLQTLAESFSHAGVPVVLADVKGDLAGLAAAGTPSPALAARAAAMGLAVPVPEAFPVRFWDVWGQQGHPLRTTPAEMGPLLLARLMTLSDAQEGVLNIAFRVADEAGLALADLADLQAMLTWVGQNARELSLRYGNVTTASVGAIQRRLLVLEAQGGGELFGEPALDLGDMLQVDGDGRGALNVIVADRLMQAPQLYAAFLLWLLSELFEQLPEVGDPEKPVVAFFFDEAHLLFAGAPAALVERIEQVARLIRSKGVSLWFITHNPADLPDRVLGQLGNRIQHALRAFTAKDQKALRAAAANYRPNPDFDIAEAIRDVGVGEAVTSFLDPKGEPGVAERTLIRPPASRIGPLTEEERAAVVAASPLRARYGARIDRESAREVLAARAGEAARQTAEAEAVAARKAETDALFRIPQGASKAVRRYDPSLTIREARRGDTLLDAFGKSVVRSVGTRAGTAIVRGVLGGLFRGR